MLPSVRALLAGIVDYAGMFPPAQLPLQLAIRNFARYRSEPEGWMLGRFICPASALAELSPFVQDLFANDPPLVVSALGTGGKSLAEFRSSLASDLDTMLGFQHRHNGRAVVDTFEARLPPDVVASKDGSDLRSVMYGPDAVLARANMPPLAAFYEVPFEPHCFVKLGNLIGALIEDGERRKGFKFRCGGASPAAVPSADDVAFAITACRTAGVPLKFTAGLHHPIRHHDAIFQALAHGFLNVFGAGVLGLAHNLSAEQVRPILEDEDAGNFVFQDSGMRWKGLAATIPMIEAARRKAVLSFGSCSFEEPCDDLHAIGLLP